MFPFLTIKFVLKQLFSKMKKNSFNIYIDESCHLEHDKQEVMCIGYTKIKSSEYINIKNEIKAIKLAHNAPTELKWNKLSMSRWYLYKDLIDYFFYSAITFRCFLLKNKSNLNHAVFNENSHDKFYYKSVYLLLNTPLNPNRYSYRVFLDIKDTRGKEKLNKISEVFDHKYYGQSPFKHFQHIHSSENELIQLTDLFIGAISYKARGEYEKPDSSEVKRKFIKYLEMKTNYAIDCGTSRHASKFNIFEFTPQNIRHD